MLKPSRRGTTIWSRFVVQSGIQIRGTSHHASPVRFDLRVLQFTILIGLFFAPDYTYKYLGKRKPVQRQRLVNASLAAGREMVEPARYSGDVSVDSNSL